MLRIRYNGYRWNTQHKFEILDKLNLSLTNIEIWNQHQTKMDDRPFTEGTIYFKHEEMYTLIGGTCTYTQMLQLRMKYSHYRVLVSLINASKSVLGTLAGSGLGFLDCLKGHLQQ
jgi:hypothetical protein